MSNRRVINLFAGAGTGKSTTCAALFAEMKYQGHNVEMISEYIKAAVWEGRMHSDSKIAKAQEYIFGKQHFQLSRVVDEVEFCITDAPLLLGLVYMPSDFNLPAMREVVLQAHHNYDNVNILLRRNKPYNPKGRLQSEEAARNLDIQIKNMLLKYQIPFEELDFGRENVNQIIDIIRERGWLSKSASLEYKEYIGHDYPLGGYIEVIKNGYGLGTIFLPNPIDRINYTIGNDEYYIEDLKLLVSQHKPLKNDKAHTYGDITKILRKMEEINEKISNT